MIYQAGNTNSSCQNDNAMIGIVDDLSSNTFFAYKCTSPSANETFTFNINFEATTANCLDDAMLPLFTNWSYVILDEQTYEDVICLDQGDWCNVPNSLPLINMTWEEISTVVPGEILVIFNCDILNSTSYPLV